MTEKMSRAERLKNHREKKEKGKKDVRLWKGSDKEYEEYLDSHNIRGVRNKNLTPINNIDDILEEKRIVGKRI